MLDMNVILDTTVDTRILLKLVLIFAVVMKFL
jgi:hypothetical protein